MNATPVRILLVEDSPSDALLLQESMAEGRPGEFDFTHAECWAEALRCMRHKQFEVLLLDLSLPDITGRDTFLRARAEAPHLPIVVLTGEANEALGLDAVRHGIQDYLIKGQAYGRQTRKTTVSEFDHFWINGVPVRRLVRKNGKDLSAEELAREDERIDKEAEKAREHREQEDAKGKETDARGEDEITLSRLLELGAFSNPRRVQLGGRDTIAVDYAGDPKARTHNRAEDVIRDIAGTAWVDRAEEGKGVE